MPVFWATSGDIIGVCDVEGGAERAKGLVPVRLSWRGCAVNWACCGGWGICAFWAAVVFCGDMGCWEKRGEEVATGGGEVKEEG